MRRIVLIACASKKKNDVLPAKDLYDSQLFRLGLEYATKIAADETFILSAKHGLLDLEEEIQPYNLTLNSMSPLERNAWAKKVIAQLDDIADLGKDEFIILAGEKYREFLTPHLSICQAPLEGLGIGEQLHYLKEAK